MGKVFNVKSRKICLVCKQPITGNRYRKYCSEKCRNKYYNRKYYHSRYMSLIKKRGEYQPGKIRCQICGKWYRQVGSHVFLRHKILAREYRKAFGFDVKRGQLSDDLRELKGAQVFENGTVKNLKKGKKFWFVSGDPKVGNYVRSEQTMDRLHRLHLFNKHKKYEAVSN